MFKSNNKRLGMLMVLLVLTIQAQAQAQNTSVGELIEKSKAARAAELMGKPTKPIGDANNKRKEIKPLVKPKVWSIAGLDEDIEAVLVHEQKAHVIRNAKLPYSLGGWLVTSIKPQEVWIKEAKNKAATSLVMVLPAPSKDTSLEAFAIDLNIQLEPEEMANFQNLPLAPNQVSQLATQPAPLPPARFPEPPPSAKPQTK